MGGGLLTSILQFTEIYRFSNIYGHKDTIFMAVNAYILDCL
jgi:hypothetical protein